jgi:hypothetical protein
MDLGTWFRWAVIVLPLLYLLIQSRQWTEPARAVRLEAVEDEIKILRGNFHRFERDTTVNMREVHECLQNILDEVRVIKANGAHEHPLFDTVRGIKDRVDDLEQAVHGLPCGQGAAPCPSKESI